MDTAWFHRKSSSVFANLRLLIGSRVIGGLVVLAGIIFVILAPIIGESTFDRLWGVDPLTYIGAILLIIGLGAISASFAVPYLIERRRNGGNPQGNINQQWSELTQQYFDLFNHDIGRPLRRILSKERDVRTLVDNSSKQADPAFVELLDEIERQTPNFRLMLSNIQVLVQLEMPHKHIDINPVEPSEVVRRVVDRYTAVAAEARKEISWWAEPTEFGIVYCDDSAIEHITTNLVDNAVRYASEHVEVKLTRNPTHFFIRVWDDGPGIAPQCLPHLFDRGWMPELARRDEKTSSGLGLFIAKTLVARYGGDISVESTTSPDPGHHTSFLISMILS